MFSLGLDLSERPARAVVADDAGEVLARASGDSGAAAVRGAAHTPTPSIAGVAIFDNSAESPSVPGIKAVTRCTPGAAAMAAEAWIGAARGARHAICLHIGDEVFAGQMLDGKPWSGAHGRAGAAGWLALNPVERQDYRKLGSLAAEVSAKGIARRLSWRVQAGDRSRVLDNAGGNLDAITGQLVFEGARAGDGVAISVVRDTAKYIGMAVATLAAAIDPEVVVVCGSVAAADLMLEPVRQECARRLPPEWMDGLRVEFSTLGPDAIAIGAARIALLEQAAAR
ncbi:MAG TPA: ROK family protein [Vicinamibacterales bacterium]|nr:ROK family protein [Vicinamibacterales bacterium]